MLRRYLVGFVAVCLAFAAGVALGNGPLQGTRPVADTGSTSHPDARLQQQLAAVERARGFDKAVASAAGAALVDGQLSHVSVGVFALPGVPADTIAGVSKAVTDAGGEVTVRARFRPALLDPGRKTYVDSVASAALHGAGDLTSHGPLTTYQRIAAEIGRAYSGAAAHLAVDAEATKLDAQLQGAKLVLLHGPLSRRASAVIVLAPGAHGSSQSVAARQQITATLVDGLAGSSDGVLVAAPGSASLPGGLLTVLAGADSQQRAVSTLNVVDLPSGQRVAVAALAATLAGHPGDFGMIGGQAVLPSGLAPSGS